jgi:hypothetical protein
MKPLLILALCTTLTASACTTTASDTAKASLSSANGEAARTPAAAVHPAYRDVTIPSGTTLPLALTSAIASDSSAVEDAVTAELTSPIRIDGRDVLPSGTLLSGIVTDVDGSGRVKGRAMIAFRFTSLRSGNSKYDIDSASLSRLAPATKGEDATKIGVGAGAGAVIGGILGGKDGAAKGAAIGGGAGTGVVLATKGQEVRLGPGTDVTTRLTAPVTVRVTRN